MTVARTEAVSKADVLRELVSILGEMRRNGDADSRDPIAGQTRLVEDLAFEAIDVARLSAAFEARNGVPGVLSAALLGDGDEYVNDLTVDDVAGLLYRNLSAAAARTPSEPLAARSLPRSTEVTALIPAAAALQTRSQTSPALPAASPYTADVMAQYFRTMATFLETQEAVMTAFLGARPTASPELGPLMAAPARRKLALEPLATTTRDEALPGPELAPKPVERQLATPTPKAGTTVEPFEPPAAEPSAERPTDPTPPLEIGSVLLRIVSEKTGYPEEMLEPGLDLEADLGIDSIKRVEILGALDMETGGAPVDVEELSRLRTLDAIIESVRAQQARFESHETSPPVPGSQSGVRADRIATDE